MPAKSNASLIAEEITLNWGNTAIKNYKIIKISLEKKCDLCKSQFFVVFLTGNTPVNFLRLKFANKT